MVDQVSTVIVDDGRIAHRLEDSVEEHGVRVLGTEALLVHHLPRHLGQGYAVCLRIDEKRTCDVPEISIDLHQSSWQQRLAGHGQNLELRPQTGIVAEDPFDGFGYGAECSAAPRE